MASFNGQLVPSGNIFTHQGSQNATYTGSASMNTKNSSVAGANGAALTPPTDSDDDESDNDMEDDEGDDGDDEADAIALSGATDERLAGLVHGDMIDAESPATAGATPETGDDDYAGVEDVSDDETSPRRVSNSRMMCPFVPSLY
jgi:hypothetical protein